MKQLFFSMIVLGLVFTSCTGGTETSEAAGTVVDSTAVVQESVVVDSTAEVIAVDSVSAQ